MDQTYEITEFYRNAPQMGGQPFLVEDVSQINNLMQNRSYSLTKCSCWTLLQDYMEDSRRLLICKDWSIEQISFSKKKSIEQIASIMTWFNQTFMWSDRTLACRLCKQAPLSIFSACALITKLPICLNSWLSVSKLAPHTLLVRCSLAPLIDLGSTIDVCFTVF